MRTNPVGWFEIYVQDLQRARKFYETVLQTKLEKMSVADLEMWAFPMDPEAKGSSGALLSVPGAPSGGNSTLVYFSSEDCSAEEQRIAGAGGRVHRGKMSIGEYGFVVLGVDPDGNMFGVHSMR